MTKEKLGPEGLLKLMTYAKQVDSVQHLTHYLQGATQHVSVTKSDDIDKENTDPSEAAA